MFKEPQQRHEEEVEREEREEHLVGESGCVRQHIVLVELLDHELSQPNDPGSKLFCGFHAHLLIPPLLCRITLTARA